MHEDGTHLLMNSTDIDLIVMLDTEQTPTNRSGCEFNCPDISDSFVLDLYTAVKIPIPNGMTINTMRKYRASFETMPRPFSGAPQWGHAFADALTVPPQSLHVLSVMSVGRYCRDPPRSGERLDRIRGGAIELAHRTVRRPIAGPHTIAWLCCAGAMLTCQRQSHRVT
jgi:hypothetical protein